MKTVRTVPVLVSALLAATVALAAQHQHEAGAPPEKLGKVRFATSCSAAVQPEFDRAVALLHSFWFPAAIDGFGKVLERDPGCGMAYWGIAMSHWGNPFAGSRPLQALHDGRAAVEKAKATGAKTPRERDYLAAVATLYKDFEAVDQRTRTLAYEKGMEQLAATYRDDREATIFYALALDQTALPSDKTYANQLKAAAMLEKESARQPEHPGIAHYIIHSYDVPSLASRALDAARRYATIAPAAPHALHMPSHTFTRLGYWQESINSNLASAEVARKANSIGEVLHAWDYQVYAYLQTAQDTAARRVVDQTKTTAASLDTAGGYGPVGLFAFAAISARYTLERRAWNDAAALVPQASRSPHTDAITHFARALGAARGGNAGAARQDIDKLAWLRDSLTQAKEGYWAEQVEIQRRVAEAWALRAEGKGGEAVALLRAAADQEDATEKSAVTPGPIAPARELLGEMLLESNQPAAALEAFEATMQKEPNRFRGVYGGARAAELAGDVKRARLYYGRLLEICQAADKPGRPELEEARKFLGRTVNNRDRR